MSMSKPITVRGYISPAEMDDDDRPIAVYLTTDDDDEYLIDPYGKGDFLRDLLDEYVEVRGVLYNDNGEYSIAVKTFRRVGKTGKNDDGVDW
jgi:hypothetical protein